MQAGVIAFRSGELCIQDIWPNCCDYIILEQYCRASDIPWDNVNAGTWKYRQVLDTLGTYI